MTAQRTAGSEQPDSERWEAKARELVADWWPEHAYPELEKRLAAALAEAAREGREEIEQAKVDALNSGIKQGYWRGVEAAARVCDGIRREVRASQFSRDDGYNSAVHDCAKSIRALAPPDEAKR